MRFLSALNVIFRLITAWKLFDDFKNTTGHIPTECPPDGNDISNLEFVGHRFLAVVGG